MLSELLRPKRLCDLVQPRIIIEPLDRMGREGRLMNMLFYGKPGVGKTSAARILIKIVNADVFEINGSLDTGIDTFRTVLVPWASLCSMEGEPKVCFIDECEKLSANAQAALRGLIEEYPKVAFLMTANDISKLDEALLSRCVPIWFDPLPSEYPEVIERLCDRYKQMLTELGFGFDLTRVKEIICLDFPDLRAIANRLELEIVSTRAA